MCVSAWGACCRAGILPHKGTGSFNGSLQAGKEARVTPLHLLAMYSREKFTGGRFVLRGILHAREAIQLFSIISMRNSFRRPSYFNVTVKPAYTGNVVFSCPFTQSRKKKKKDHFFHIETLPLCKGRVFLLLADFWAKW